MNNNRNNEPLIVWEKWIDPFGQAMDDAKWTDYENEIDDLEDVEFLDEDLPIADKPIRAIATPMGIIPYNEFTAPAHIFNFWVAHTNFNISSEIARTIEESAGVEILDIFTRYRFRIGIGKCFNDSEIMKNINDNIYQKLSMDSSDE